MDTETDSNKHNSSLLERLGMGFAAGVLMEFAFWIFAGLLWIAFSGGVWGIVIALALAGCVVFVWWDLRKSDDPNQLIERND